MTKPILIRLHGPVDRFMFEKVERRLGTVPKGSAVVFHVQSSGGQLLFARKISRLILGTSRDCETVAVGYGRVDSAAAHIFVSCTYRVAYDHTRFFLHLPSDALGEHSDNLFQDEEVSYMSRMTRTPEHVMGQLMSQGVSVSVSEAARLGIINFPMEKRMLAKS